MHLSLLKGFVEEMPHFGFTSCQLAYWIGDILKLIFSQNLRIRAVCIGIIQGCVLVWEGFNREGAFIR